MIDLNNISQVSVDLFRDLDPDTDKVLYKGKFVKYLGCFKDISNVPIEEGVYLYFLKNQVRTVNANLLTETIYGVAYRPPCVIKQNHGEIGDKNYIFEKININNKDNLLMATIKKAINDLKMSKEELKEAFKNANYKDSDIQNILRKISLGGDLTFKKFVEIVAILPNCKIDIKVLLKREGKNGSGISTK